MYTLFAHPGWGSVLIEAQLAWYGLPYQLEDVGNLFEDRTRADRLRRINPLLQLPTLVLPDGQGMSESAAITLHLADVTGRTDLVPAAPRPAFLRWLVFFVANIYPTFTYADKPSRFVVNDEAQAAFRASVDAYALRLWHMVEAEAGAPWFLGQQFSVLDLYVATMTHWRPRRAWFAAEAPRLHAIALATDALPQLTELWGRNFRSAG